MNNRKIAAEKGYARIPGAVLYYEIAGEGSSLTFVHGLGLDCRMWDDQFSAFAARFRVLRYDLRGFGNSSVPSSAGYAHHEDLYELLTHLNIRQSALVGLSMGGRVVIDFSLTYPKMITALVPVDAAVGGYTFRSFSTEAIMKLAQESGIEAANRAWFEHELFAPARRKDAVRKKLAAMVNSYSGWQWLNKNPWVALDPPACHRLEKIRVPAMVMVGEEDLPDFQAIADLLSQQIPQASKEVLKMAGHLCNMETPDSFNRLLQEFLESLEQKN
jgi:3-oxoadipate enol-lactonase